MKELLANEEMIKATNEDYMNKFRGERDNYDQLLKDRIELEEKLTRLQEDLRLDTEAVDAQDVLLDNLKKEIEAEQAAVDELTESVTQNRETKRLEEERNRRI